jgi:hypothetical protein
MANAVIVPTLTNLVRDYKPEVNYVSEAIFPVVPVRKNPFKYKLFGKDMFKVFKTLRAKFAKTNVAHIEGADEATVDMKPHALANNIDLEHTPTEELATEKERSAIAGKERMTLALEVDAAAKLNDISLYSTGHKVTLSGTNQWNDYTNSDPIGDIFAGKQAVAKKIGKDPNLLVLPKDVYNVLIFHPQLKQIALNGQEQAATIEILKTKFDIKDIEVADGLKLDEANDEFEYIWSKNAWLLYRNPNQKPSKEDVSFGYRFRMPPYPYVDRYEQDGGKILIIRGNDFMSDEITCIEAAYFINAAIA